MFQKLYTLCYNEINDVGVIMKIELDNMTIEYNNCDLDYIDFLVGTLNKRSEDIINFFCFEKLEPKVRVRLWPNLEKFREFATYCLQKEVQESSCGFVHKENETLIVEILSLQMLINTKHHEQYTINDLVTLILHEFAHACHFAFSNEDSYTWLFEGLATFLSQQYDTIEYNFLVTLEDIIYGDNIDYRIFYTMFYYVYNTYGKEYIYSLIKSNALTQTETPRLFKKTKEFVEQMKIRNRRIKYEKFTMEPMAWLS